MVLLKIQKQKKSILYTFQGLLMR
ncbi:UNVERIFIED_CONTAM: hypothetical protein GTU68_024340 [Idotea baltica]|nr:hypothetical protein [Idotea baltica]